MELNSLRNLLLPPKIASTPEDVCREVLTSLFEVATGAVLICPGTHLQELAQLTCGIGPLLRDGTELTILILVDEQEVPLLDPASIEREWRNTLLIKNIEYRLSTFRFFADAGRLRIAVRSAGGGGSRHTLDSFLSERRGAVLLVDAERTEIEVLWETPLNFEAKTDVSAEIRWSFGDPLALVRKLSTAVQQTIGAQSCSSQTEEALRGLISELPYPALPWEELFTLPEETGLRLFPHQEQAIEEWFSRGCHGIFKMCTGAGKTIASLAAAQRCAEKLQDAGQRVLPVIVTVPTRVLADQWCREIQRLGFPNPLRAYNSKQLWHPVLRAVLRSSSGDGPKFVVTTYASFGDPAFTAILKDLARDGHRGIWIADEMHNLASSRLLDQMESLATYFTHRIGLSATPEIENEPAKTRRLFLFFEDGRSGPCGRYELADGIRDGVLCRYHYHPFPQYLQPENSQRFMEILSALEEQEAAGRIDIDLYRQKREIIRTSGVQVEAFRRLLDKLLMAGASALRHTLVYCPPGYGTSRSEVDAAESDDSADEEDEDRLLSEVIRMLADRGIMAESILGTTPASERERILRDFRAGEIQVLCAVACLDEGVDIPDIRRAIVLYSVNREKQFVQRRGRILRRNPSMPSKVAEIHDVIILPQGSNLPPARSDELLKREMRRYDSFAELADNRSEADQLLALALHGANGNNVPQTVQI